MNIPVMISRNSTVAEEKKDNPSTYSPGRLNAAGLITLINNDTCYSLECDWMGRLKELLSRAG